MGCHTARPCWCLTAIYREVGGQIGSHVIEAATVEIGGRIGATIPDRMLACMSDSSLSIHPSTTVTACQHPHWPAQRPSRRADEIFRLDCRHFRGLPYSLLTNALSASSTLFENSGTYTCIA